MNGPVVAPERLENKHQVIKNDRWVALKNGPSDLFMII